MHERDCGCDGRLVNGFCLVLGITLYNALTLRYKQRSQKNKETKEKQFSAHPCLNLLCFMNILLGLLAYRNRREMLRETLQADEQNP